MKCLRKKYDQIRQPYANDQLIMFTFVSLKMKWNKTGNPRTENAKK